MTNCPSSELPHTVFYVYESMMSVAQNSSSAVCKKMHHMGKRWVKVCPEEEGTGEGGCSSALIE